MLWIVANWKMHGSRSTIEAFGEALKAGLHDQRPGEKPHPRCEVVWCPPFPYLGLMRAEWGIKWGGQTCYPSGLASEDVTEGPYTGQVSAKMLRDMGCQYVIVGHAERHEPLYVVRQQIQAACQSRLVPIVCVGAPLDIPSVAAGAWVANVVQTLTAGIRGRLLIAYEPLQAIGGPPAQMAEIADVLRYIRDVTSAPVLYGGGVEAENIRALGQLPFQGFLLGRSSLSVDQLMNCLKIMKEKLI